MKEEKQLSMLAQQIISADTYSRNQIIEKEKSLKG